MRSADDNETTLGVAEPPVEEVLEEAVSAVTETCSRQLEIYLVPARTESPSDTATRYTSAIELDTGKGRWILAIHGDRHSVATLARKMFAMGENEEIGAEDMADALNELVNVAAGVLKSYRLDAGQTVGLGLPSFRERRVADAEAAPPSDPARRSLIDLDGIALLVTVHWQEGASDESEAS